MAQEDDGTTSALCEKAVDARSWRRSGVVKLLIVLCCLAIGVAYIPDPEDYEWNPEEDPGKEE
jgi:hypothetical protein